LDQAATRLKKTKSDKKANDFMVIAVNAAEARKRSIEMNE
jgi:hypothetical protein